MQRVNLAKLTVWKFPRLQVGHAFIGRAGGHSQPPYETLNLGLHVGDDPVRVRANRQEVAFALNLPLKLWVACEQVHGAEVAVVGQKERGRGSLDCSSALPGADALVTNTPEMILAAYFADCVPLYFWDPGRKIIGLAHAGWRGTVAGVGASTIRTMERVFTCRVQEIQVGIGPSIGPCCYEVDEPVVEGVRQAFPTFWRQVLQFLPEGKARLDLAATNSLALQQAGVQAENISLASLCTACHPEFFFSYRRQGGITGRMAALLWLPGEEGVHGLAG